MSVNDIKIIESRDDDGFVTVLKTLCDAINSLSDEVTSLRTDVDKLIENGR